MHPCAHALPALCGTYPPPFTIPNLVAVPFADIIPDALSCTKALSLLMRRCSWELLVKNPDVKFVPQIRLASGPARFRFKLDPLPGCL